jgi:hypothetical protein
VIVPPSANVVVGQAVTFAVTSGLPPYTITANGGTANPTTVNTVGGSFQYTATQAGVFTIIAVDALGRVAQATVSNSSGITAAPNPICVAPSGSVVVTITGGAAPYTVSVTGLVGSNINGSPPPISTASPTFTYSAPVLAGNGQLVISDSGALSTSIPIKVNNVCP